MAILRLARGRPVDLPVAHDGCSPCVALARDAEAGDDTLSALVVAVQEVDPEPPRANELDDLLAPFVVAKRNLPEADPARRDVQVADESAEFLEGRMLRLLADADRADVRTVEDADAGPTLRSESAM